MALPFRVLTGVAIVVYVAAALAYALHGLDTNPQYDNQGIFYAKDWIEDMYDGTVGTFLLTKRKYPLGHVLPFAAAEYVTLLARGEVPVTMMATIGRTITMLFGLGVFVVLWRIGRRLGHGTESILLLMTSLLFLLFTSAIRPHIPVAFWTLLTLLASIRLREKTTLLRTLLAFACAGCAFATLQNGLLAFLFPVWAMLRWKLQWKNTVSTSLWLIGSVAIAAVLGYPFLLAPFFGVESSVGIDLGHDVGLRFNAWMPLSWMQQLLGGEVVLIGFALAGAWWMIRRRKFVAPWMLAIAAYIILYLVVFGFHNSTAGRFFLPVFPLLALLGSPVLARLSMPWKAGVPLFIVLVCAKLLWLSLQPNTYQQMSTFVADRPGKVGTVSQPAYFFSFDEARRVTSTDSLDVVPTIVIPDYRSDLQAQSTTWLPCFHAVASNTTNEIVLLWNDTQWGLWHVFEATALGPNMTAFCRDPVPSPGT